MNDTYAEGTAEWVIDRAQASAKTSDGRHRAVLEVLQYFAWAHLPEHLQAFSAPIGRLALSMVEHYEDVPELTRGLHSLLEAKDCFVRAALPIPEQLRSGSDGSV